ncbi:uncharacterized protein [Rutidosis leptorrhynchoides]|uniref:uncharacterized protein n=1 Tax=Rutidosis leptorrhynchoides TaxID=125765 RepID=UPI003A997F10
MSGRVNKVIREEIGYAKYCILVDEARDESKKEQMSIILRFVDKNGYVQERFFGLVHVKDTATSTLRDEILFVLSQHNLDVQNIRRQGYDGASNMRGDDQLKAAHAENIAHLLVMDELESGIGLNRVCNLQRVGDTRWSSHLRSVSSLINMFSATCEILMIIIDDGATSTQRANADTTYEVLTSYEFVFTLHLVMKVLEITDLLCRTLQLKSQDILNIMDVVKSTKTMIQELRDKRWDDLIKNVNTFCDSVSIVVPNLDDHYISRRGRAHHQQEDITMEHHYKVDIFNALVDTQLHELNIKFNDHAMELLTLSSAKDPKKMRNSFRIDDICTLVDKYYPQDFAGHEKGN